MASKVRIGKATKRNIHCHHETNCLRVVGIIRKYLYFSKSSSTCTLLKYFLRYFTPSLVDSVLLKILIKQLQFLPMTFVRLADHMCIVIMICYYGTCLSDHLYRRPPNQNGQCTIHSSPPHIKQDILVHYNMA